MTIQEVLEQALKMEEDGRQFYLEGYERVSSSLSKEVLKRLADEELVHIERIKEGYNKVTKGEAFAVENWGGIRKPTREYFDNVFTEARKNMNEIITPGAQELDVIQASMDLESKSHQFYVEKSKEVEDDKVREFLDFLASEEYRHYNLLFNTYEYLSNPTSWYYREEKPIFEGG
ncbi:MAG TPA: ferritin family protein [Candidatus Atribacteria bacterium]|mgnify:CR=1 FL=1|nr:ferritin family protein [Candidatus Atribacteria bacterium]